MSDSWPWQYSFPPFFTLQPHGATREKQLEAWRHLILSYCQNHNISLLDLAEAAELPLFHNRDISRRLSSDAIRTVLEDLASRGNVEWTDKGKKRCYVYWKSPQQLGQRLYAWAEANGLVNTVMTTHELLMGDDSEGQPWFNLNKEVFVKAIRTLEAEKKAELFDDQEGVKFF